MKRLPALLIRAAGGDPARVLPLLAAMRLDAHGQHEILRTRDARRFMLSPDGMHILGLVLAGLGSVGLVFAFILGASRGQPLLGPIVLCVAQVLFLAWSIVGQVVPALLCDDDERTVGWWPLSRRDMLLARLGTVLVPALQMTTALALAPLAAFVFTGRPPVLAALLLAFAVLLQTVVLAMGAAAITSGLVRLVGPRQARRLASPLVDGNLAALPLLLLPAAEPLMRFVSRHPTSLDWVPPVWFARFGDPFGGPAAWRGMALALALSAVVGWVGWRLAAPRTGSPVAAAPEPAGRRRRHWTDLLPLLLRPWLRGREGWVTGRLLAAHLRDDWRFAANTLLNVAILGAMLWYYSRPDAAGGDATRDLLFGGAQMLLFMAIAIPFLIAFSSTPRALWIVALADLDPVKLLAAQRGLMRGLTMFPLLAVMAFRGVDLGVPWPTLAAALIIVALEGELLVLFSQRMQPLLAFSRGYTRDQSSHAMLRGFLLLGVLLAAFAANFAAASQATARLALLGILPLLIFAMRREVARHVAGSRLNVAEIVG